MHCLQKKLKPGEAQVDKPKSTATTGAATKPLLQRDTNKAVPAARRPASATGPDVAKKTTEEKGASKAKGTRTLASGTPRRAMSRTASTTGQSNGSPGGRAALAGRNTVAASVKSPIATRKDVPKKAFSPPKQPVTAAQEGDKEDDEDVSGPFTGMSWSMSRLSLTIRYSLCREPAHAPDAEGSYASGRRSASFSCTKRDLSTVAYILAHTSHRTYTSSSSKTHRVRRIRNLYHRVSVSSPLTRAVCIVR